ncbi:MAG: sugar phosphate isomerase/epimerase [Clostridia bacterium]|nr:sugar phosphate isomerase/epimerase [Clostridia bacterium]
MYQQKIGISVANTYSMPTPELIPHLKQIGFDAISPEWSKAYPLAPVAEAAKKAGLILQSLHAPYTGSADLWSEDEAVSAPALADVLASLEDAKTYGIPVLVVHAWIGFGCSFVPTEAGFRNYDAIVAKAKEYGIRIALENTEGEEYLFALLDRYVGNDTVGYCWDSGHEMCYNHSKDLLALYGDRLIMTHLNDNLGIRRFDGDTFWHDDLHLLPYDGIADWDYNIARLRASRPMEILNFELNIGSKPNRHENDKYMRLPIVEYFTEAYSRACRVAYRYAK